MRLRLFKLSTGAPSLTLRTSGQQGMHVHLSRARRDQARLNEADAFVKLAESASTKTYVFQAWSQLGGIIGSTSMALAAAEKEAFQELMAQVCLYLPSLTLRSQSYHSNSVRKVLESSEHLKTNAAVQDELDVALGFATLARELQFTRPTIVEESVYFSSR
jgi:DNA mismatch repair ATPase MutS